MESPREGHGSRPIEHIKGLSLADRDIHRVRVAHCSHKLEHLLLLGKLLLLVGRVRSRLLVSHVHGQLLLV